MPNTPIVNAGISYTNGLRTARSGLRLITIYEGQTRDSSNTNDIILDSTIVVNGDENGANGLDTGTMAIGRYALYLIGDSTEYNPTAGLLSLNTTSPLLPFGYDMYKRIGWNYTSFTVTPPFARYTMIGNGSTKVYYLASPVEVLNAGASTTYAEVDLTVGVPPIVTEIVAYLVFTPNAPGNFAYFTTTDFSPADGICIYGNSGDVQRGMVRLPVTLNGSGVPVIRYKVSSASDSLTILVSSFTDYI